MSHIILRAVMTISDPGNMFVSFNNDYMMADDRIILLVRTWL